MRERIMQTPIDIEETLGLNWPYLEVVLHVSNILHELDKQARGRPMGKARVIEASNSIKTLMEIAYCERCNKEMKPHGSLKTCDECTSKMRPGVFPIEEPRFREYV